MAERKGRDHEGRRPRRVRSCGESVNVAEDKDRVWMVAVDDCSNANNEGELVECFGEEDNEDFWLTDGKSNSPPSSTSTFYFIDSSNLFDNSGDLSDSYDLKLNLEDITDSSDNKENDVPLLK